MQVTCHKPDGLLFTRPLDHLSSGRSSPVLGPLLFALFMSPISNVINSFGVSQTQYADDTQLYIGLNDVMPVPTLSDCFTAMQHWLDLNGLSKTEAIVIGTGARQGSAGTLDLKCFSVKLATSIRSLGVRIDNTLSFNEHVDSICKSSHFHLRALRHLWKHILADTAKTIARSMVDGQLEYCNSVLYGTSAMNLNKLQRVQNSAARIVTGFRRFEHALPLLAELHCLPIKHQIHYKIAVTAFKVQHKSRATLPTSSGFVLLHANFGPAEGICYTTLVLI